MVSNPYHKILLFPNNFKSFLNSKLADGHPLVLQEILFFKEVFWDIFKGIHHSWRDHIWIINIALFDNFRMISCRIKYNFSHNQNSCWRRSVLFPWVNMHMVTDANIVTTLNVFIVIITIAYLKPQSAVRWSYGIPGYFWLDSKNVHHVQVWCSQWYTFVHVMLGWLNVL